MTHVEELSKHSNDLDTNSPGSSLKKYLWDVVEFEDERIEDSDAGNVNFSGQALSIVLFASASITDDEYFAICNMSSSSIYNEFAPELVAKWISNK